MKEQPGQDAARTNQARTEPLPATPESEPGQEAVRRNEELGSRGAALERSSPAGPPGVGGGTPAPPWSTAAVPAAEAPTDAPGVQAARAHREKTDRSDRDGRPRVSGVANAVRGKPDGEVDTRPDQPATGTDTP